MSHVKNVSRDLLNLKLDNETSLSHSRSVDADLPRPDAVWVFPAGTVCGDGGFWRDGIPVLHETEDGGYRHIRGASSAVSTHLQDCAGTGDVECNRCADGGTAHRAVRARETT